MPTKDQLSEEVVNLADEELIDRLRSGNLTEMATDIFRRELATRGVDLTRALAQPAEAPALHRRISASTRRRFVEFLRRVLSFPLRAALGVEPLWAVIVFGSALLFLLFKLIRYGLDPFLAVWPRPPYALAIAYAAIALIAVAMAWFAFALWRTAGRAKSLFWKISVRVLALLVALYTVLGPLTGMRVVQQYFGSPPASVMDSVPKQ